MCFKRELHRKMMTLKTAYGILKEIKELELDYMEHNYMSTKSHKRCHGTSRNLKVMVKSHLMMFDTVKIKKVIFMSLELFYFHIHSLVLMHDQIENTEHYS